MLNYGRMIVLFSFMSYDGWMRVMFDSSINDSDFGGLRIYEFTTWREFLDSNQTQCVTC